MPWQKTLMHLVSDSAEAARCGAEAGWILSDESQIS